MRWSANDARASATATSDFRLTGLFGIDRADMGVVALLGRPRARPRRAHRRARPLQHGMAPQAIVEFQDDAGQAVEAMAAGTLDPFRRSAGGAAARREPRAAAVGMDDGCRRPRDAVTRPCAGRALPWNASFMTIPFEMGGFARKHQIGSSGNSNRPTLGLRAGGFAVGGYRETSMKLCATGWVRPTHVSLVWSFHSVGRAHGRRISAGYFGSADIRRLGRACRTAASIPG